MSANIRYINHEPWSNLFEVSPSQFNVTCELQKEEFLQLSIINTCNDCIAWKLKTNRPGRYMVSPKQGIISSKQHKDCTVVLTKLRQVPDTKKPDKFLIQATKIDPNTQPSDLPQLWKDRESKHNKKGGAYAYQSVTIKCFLHVDTSKSAESKKKNMTIIEDYVSSETTNVIQPQTQTTQQPQTPQQYPPSKPIDAVPEKTEIVENNTKDIEITKNTDNISANAAIPPQTDSGNQYNPQTVEKWKRKALEYDEMFQYLSKTLRQRDELKMLLKAEKEKTRKLQKVSKDMKEEKKRILSEYNQQRNNHKRMMDQDMNDEDEYEEEEEKEDSMIEGLTARRSQKQRDEMARNMEEIDKEARQNTKSRCTISILQILFTVFLMYFAFIAGKYNTNTVSEINGETNNNKEEEMNNNTAKEEM